jgi:hypothetical protein
MNLFGLCFEYLNNIGIFILLNKLSILAQTSKKNQNCVERPENSVSRLICIQNGQQITKLIGLFTKYFGKLPESRQFLMVY